MSKLTDKEIRKALLEIKRTASEMPLDKAIEYTMVEVDKFTKYCSEKGVEEGYFSFGSLSERIHKCIMNLYPYYKK